MDLLLRRNIMMVNTIPYQRVEYLENTDFGQYINIYAPPDENISPFELEIRLRFSTLPTTAYCGCGITATSATQFFIGCNASANTGIYMCFGPSATGTLATKLANSEKTGWHTYRVISDGANCTYYVDGEQVFQHNKTNINIGAYRFSLFRIYGGINNNGIQQIQYAKFSRSGTPVFNVVAVRDGQTGYMYDTVRKRLFGNDGTGDFVVGNDI